MQKRWKLKRRNGDSIILRDVCEKLIKWVQKFKEVGDTAVQYDTAHAALPWAAVRLLLQVSINDVETITYFCRFRWASLQIQNLCNPHRMKIVRDVEDALDRLPETLSELYALIFDQIQKTEPGGRSIAIHTLQWLLCAQVSLSVEQMVDLVSFPSRILFSDVIGAADVLAVCCNLVVLDQELNCFRFAHVSVRDFFEGRNRFENDTVHTMAVRRCFDIYDTDPLDRSPTPVGRFQTRPSFEYAARYWIVHYKCVDEGILKATLKERVQSFFFSGRQIRPSVEYWIIYLTKSALLFDPYAPLREIFSIVDRTGVGYPWFIGIALGLPEILASL